MAIVARTLVAPATQEDHDRLNGAVERRLMDQGGPPDGLMSLVTFPDEDGFIIVEVWRNEETFASYVRDVFVPALSRPEVRRTGRARRAGSEGRSGHD
ncbi:MAG TPA: hypothetical protein VIY72_16625 [Acidimicrobiales bacterium]